MPRMPLNFLFLVRAGYVRTTVARILPRFAALALACPLVAVAVPARCPDIEGTFILAEDSAASNNALRTLGGGSGAVPGGSLTIKGSAKGTLLLSLRYPRPDEFSRPVEWSLNNPSDFKCDDGWLVPNRPVDASRLLKNGAFEGRATARFAPAAGGLSVEVRFKGSESARIFSYDSAKIDVPVPWSRAAATDHLTWPEGAEVVFRRAPVASARAAEPVPVADARRLLSSTGLLVSDVVAEETQVRAKVSTTPQQLARLEDKLRAAGVAYQVPESSVQTGSAYFVNLVLPQRPGATSLPSRLWVEQELTRWRHPSSDVNKVVCRDGVCIAQLGLRSGLSVEDATARLRSLSTAFSEVRVLPDTENTLSASLRTVDVQLRPR